MSGTSGRAAPGAAVASLAALALVTAGLQAAVVAINSGDAGAAIAASIGVWFQGLWAVFAWRRPGRDVLVAGLVANLALLAVSVARLATRSGPAQPSEVLVAVFELVLVAGLGWTLARPSAGIGGARDAAVGVADRNTRRSPCGGEPARHRSCVRTARRGQPDRWRRRGSDLVDGPGRELFERAAEPLGVAHRRRREPDRLGVTDRPGPQPDRIVDAGREPHLDVDAGSAWNRSSVRAIDPRAGDRGDAGRRDADAGRHALPTGFGYRHTAPYRGDARPQREPFDAQAHAPPRGDADPESEADPAANPAADAVGDRVEDSGSNACADRWAHPEPDTAAGGGGSSGHDHLRVGLRPRDTRDHRRDDHHSSR